MELNKEQSDFLNFVESHNHKNGMILLKAPAGRGKTFLAKYLKKMYKKAFIVIAPTHKAKNILKKDIKDAETIHKFFNSSYEVDEDGKKHYIFKKVNYSNKIIFVDECSMITKKMFKIFEELSNDNLIIFSGDDLQLPPVNDLSPEDIENDLIISKISDISVVFKNVENVFELTQNMRVKNTSNLIVEKAREYIISKNEIPNSIIEVNINQIIECFKNPNYSHLSKIILAYTNIKVNKYNKLIRMKLFNVCEEELKKYYIGEELVYTGMRKYHEKTYHTSDIIKITNIDFETIFLNYAKCNCQLNCNLPKYRVEGFEINFYKLTDNDGNIWYKPFEEQDIKNFIKIKLSMKSHCIKMRDSNKWRNYYDFLETHDPDLKYSYSSTIHKSQGSEWDLVFVDKRNIMDVCKNDLLLKKHCYYTALSRMKCNVFEIGDNCNDIQVFEYI